jgi:hypothetical protein
VSPAAYLGEVDLQLRADFLPLNSIPLWFKH